MWHDQTAPRNEVQAPCPPPSFFKDLCLSLQCFQPLSLRALKQRKHLCRSYAIRESRNSFLFNLRVEDLAAAPEGTLNKQKNTLLLNLKSRRLIVVSVLRRRDSSGSLSSYITGQTKACYSFLELKGEVLALVLGMDRWSLEDVVAPSGDLLLVNILCPVRSKML